MNSLRLTEKAHRAGPIYLHSRKDFNNLYDQYAPMLYGYLLRQTENASLANSILIAVFVTVWQERVAFNKSQSTSINQTPLSCLLRIAHRKERDHQSSAQ